MTTQTNERTEAAQELLARFRVLGLRLKELRTRRGEDADAERARIAEKIRKAYAEACELGVYGREIAAALGVSRQQVYNIVNDVKKIRTPPRRDTLLVSLTPAQRDALLAATDSIITPTKRIVIDDDDLHAAISALRNGHEVTWREARLAMGQ
jgi:transcriptional regulator with XRE-family HTH domain